MKKRQRRLMGLMLVCMMTCLPAAQAYAQTDYETSAGVSDQILFPGDSLLNVTGAVMLDGEEKALEEDGSWKNKNEDKVYKANTAEDGSIEITEVGYVVEVQGGKADGEKNHYEFLDWELPESPKDIAYFEQGTRVVISAEVPEGMVFAGWTSETEGIVFEDSSSAQTAFTMEDKKVVVKANFVQADPSGSEDPGADGEDPAANPSGSEDPAVTGEDPAADPSGSEDPVVIGEDPAADPSGSEDPVVIGEDPAEYSVTVNDGSGSGSYEAGSWVTVTADEKEGFSFNGWYVDSMNASLDDLSAPTAGFTMPDGDVILSAQYQEIPEEPTEFEVIVNYGTGSGFYQADAWVSVEAQDRSEEGLTFAGWTVDSQNVTLEDAYSTVTSFTMPQDGVTLTALYTEPQAQPEAETYKLKVNNAEVSTLDGSTGDEFPQGTEISLTAKDRTEEGLIFSGWVVESQNLELDSLLEETVRFTMPAEDVTIAASYASIEEEPNEEPEPTTPEATTGEPKPTTPEAPIAETEPTTPEAPIAETEPTTPEAPIAETEPTTPEAPIAETEPTTPEVPVEQLYQVQVENGNGSGEYAAGREVTIEAPEQDGKKFVQWKVESGAVTLSDPTLAMTTFVMPEEDVKVTAEYAEKTYVVELIDASFADDDVVVSKEVAKGTEVRIKADDKTAEGMKFTGWAAVNYEDGVTDAGVAFADPAASETTFVMPEKDITVFAEYEAIPNTYKVKVSNGLITSASTGISGSTSELTVEEGTEITVKANQSPSGQAFAYWKINDGDFNIGDATWSEEIKLTVDQDLNILAVYEGIEYNVTVKDGSSDYDTCVSGTTVQIKADKAPAGMKFDFWQVDSGNATLADAYSETTTFTMPQDDVTVSAHYKKLTFQVTVENGTTSSQYYNAGDTVTISSNYPASGRVFDQWVATSGNVQFVDASRWQTTFTMPAADVNVKATYKDGPSTNDNVILDIVAGGEYLTGSTIKFTASGAGMGNTNPNPGDYRYRPSGYQIGNVTGTWQSAPYATSMSIKAAGDYTLKVIYNKDVYDGTNWISEGSSDAKSVTFRVVTEAASVQTGDDTPIMTAIAIAVVSCAVFLILLVIFLRRRRNR